MIRIARRLTATLASAALLSFALSGVASADTPPQIANPTSAAAGWLVDNFMDDTCAVTPDGDRVGGAYGGTCYPNQGGTIDAIFALAAAKAGGDKLDAVAAYLESAIEDYAGTAPDAEYGISAGGAAKALLALQVLDIDPDVQSELEDVVNANICTPADADADDEGCAGPGAARNIYSSVSQSFVLLALGRAGSGEHVNEAVDFLLDATRCSTGGFTSDLTNAPTCVDSVDATAYALSGLTAVRSLVADTGAIDAAILSTVEFLRSGQEEGGSWGAQNVNSTGLAISALSDYVDDERVAAAIEAGKTWLAAQQLGCAAETGQVGAIPYAGVYGADTFKATTDAMLGLAGESLVTLSAEGIAAAAPAQDCTVAPTTEQPTTQAPSIEAPSTTPEPSAPATMAAPTLAATGTHDAQLVGIGAALLLLGAGALLLGRRGAES